MTANVKDFEKQSSSNRFGSNLARLLDMILRYHMMMEKNFDRQSRDIIVEVFKDWDTHTCLKVCCVDGNIWRITEVRFSKGDNYNSPHDP